MTKTPITDCWRFSAGVFGDLAESEEEYLALLKIYVSGAYAAIHYITGFDIDGAYQILAVDNSRLREVMLELAAYVGKNFELLEYHSETIQ